MKTKSWQDIYIRLVWISSLVFPKLVCGQPRNERETNVIHRDFISRERVSEPCQWSKVDVHTVFRLSLLFRRNLAYPEISACRNQISLHQATSKIEITNLMDPIRMRLLWLNTWSDEFNICLAIKMWYGEEQCSKGRAWNWNSRYSWRILKYSK